MTAQPTVSFEFFPPKTPEGEKALWHHVRMLAACKPAFVTMTMTGDLGAEKCVDMTIKLAQHARGIPTAAHLTFVHTPIEQLKELTDKLWDNGVRRIVALRGDGAPLLDGRNYFQYTTDFIAALKTWHDFDISVGAYPEKHPSADTDAECRKGLRLKWEAGANRALTQFFFDPDVYLEFCEKLKQENIDIQVAPGILPILDFQKMLNFAERCKATVPDWLRKKFAEVSGNKEAEDKLAADILCKLVTDLADKNVGHIHFYTLNKSALPLKACEALGLVSAMSPA
jgi:methylenetetrahydrofolate reductase (NADPH)